MDFFDAAINMVLDMRGKIAAVNKG